jgi:hypothetical protein
MGLPQLNFFLTTKGLMGFLGVARLYTMLITRLHNMLIDPLTQFSSCKHIFSKTKFLNKLLLMTLLPPHFNEP